MPDRVKADQAPRSDHLRLEGGDLRSEPSHQ